MIAGIGRDATSVSAFSVALFVHLLARTKGTQEAINALVKTIPYGLKLSNEEDLIFQVNRPYTSRQVPQVEMNSIIKWSMDRFQVVTISISGDGPTGPALAGGPSPASQIQTPIGATVGFDINSPPLQPPLTHS